MFYLDKFLKLGGWLKKYRTIGKIIQPMYNLVKRQAEVEILPLGVSEQIGVISYSPLGAGLLTGKYGLNKQPEQGRLVEEKRYTDSYIDEINFVVADRFMNMLRN